MYNYLMVKLVNERIYLCGFEMEIVRPKDFTGYNKLPNTHGNC